MVDVRKREDAMLDTISELTSRIDLMRMQIEIFRAKGLTEGEIEMLNTFEYLLKKNGSDPNG